MPSRKTSATGLPTRWRRSTTAAVAPRVVLFSPIAHEDLQNPDLPDGKENNQRLAMYSKAMGEVASAANVTFVDLFTPTLKAYADSKAPLTIQGIHLNTEGNRQVAQIVGSHALRRRPKYTDQLLATLRQAVVDKDKYWFQRYRATDGYATYGDRAFLSFVRGNPRNVNADQMAKVAKEDVLPTNYETLQREVSILDVMTRNRDRRIWAVAGGSDLKVDDSNTPGFVDAQTNEPGEGPGGKHVFLGGAEAIAKMTPGKGLKVDLFASEKEFPELVNPVQMAFDTKGRLWVAAWKSYPHWQPKTPMDDKLLILEDTNGDGKADKCTCSQAICRTRPALSSGTAACSSVSSRTSCSSRTRTATTSTTRRKSCCTVSTPPTRTTR